MVNLFDIIVFTGIVCSVQNVLGFAFSASAIDSWFRNLNEQLHQINHYSAEAGWSLSTDLPNENTAATLICLAEQKTHLRNEYCKMSDNNQFKSNLSPLQHRMLYLLCRGPKFNREGTRRFITTLGRMQQIYTETKICVPTQLAQHELWDNTYVMLADGAVRPLIFYANQTKSSFLSPMNALKCFDGEPDLQRIMTGDFSLLENGPINRITNKEEILRWAWQAWRLAIGPTIATVYPKAVGIMNIAAMDNHYRDISAVWREELEIENLPFVVKQLLADVRPLYKLIHAVVRDALRKMYSNVPDFGPIDPIPAHLLGNMWSQNWEPLLQYVLANASMPTRFEKSGWSPKEMANKADDFYSSLGLPAMNRQFWSKSNFEKTSNATKCHGTAADMYAKGDFRMIVCARTTIDDFYVIVHEMGHIQYYEAYEDQPAVMKEGSNSALQESIGDTIYLAFMTPQHLNRLGLVNDRELFIGGDKSENNIDGLDLELLLRMSLAKIPQIPFEHIMDEFRFHLFDGTVSMSEANAFFWMLTEKHQGIRPPSGDWLNRRNIFDAGSKYHLADNTPFLRYFFASFLQAQIFKALCERSVLDKINSDTPLPMPLHRCDVYGSKRAGKLLKHAMALGGSETFTEILYKLTGKRSVSSDAFLEYYEPLKIWLENYVRIHKLPLGWSV